MTQSFCSESNICITAVHSSSRIRRSESSNREKLVFLERQMTTGARFSNDIHRRKTRRKGTHLVNVLVMLVICAWIVVLYMCECCLTQILLTPCMRNTNSATSIDETKLNWNWHELTNREQHLSLRTLRNVRILYFYCIGPMYKPEHNKYKENTKCRAHDLWFVRYQFSLQQSVKVRQNYTKFSVHNFFFSGTNKGVEWNVIFNVTTALLFFLSNCSNFSYWCDALVHTNTCMGLNLRTFSSLVYLVEYSHSCLYVY